MVHGCMVLCVIAGMHYRDTEYDVTQPGLSTEQVWALSFPTKFLTQGSLNRNSPWFKADAPPMPWLPATSARL